MPLMRYEQTEFQFPSNGKVYSEKIGRTRNSVRDTSFNSLQTGKCIQSYSGEEEAGLESCFNSLQTGKCIQRKLRYPFRVLSIRKLVSIPFKRESVFRGKKFTAEMDRKMFQFPSNGKVYSE